MLRAGVVPAIASHCLYLECSAIKGPGMSHKPLIGSVSGQAALLHPTMTMDGAPETLWRGLPNQSLARIGSVGCKKVLRYASIG
jgi:hypothetical protein